MHAFTRSSLEAHERMNSSCAQKVRERLRARNSEVIGDSDNLNALLQTGGNDSFVVIFFV